jgi:hypothetical protein
LPTIVPVGKTRAARLVARRYAIPGPAFVISTAGVGFRLPHMTRKRGGSGRTSCFTPFGLLLP